MIKQFAIFKSKEKKNDKSPDYNISVKYNDKYVTIGGGWIKEGKSGKFISCKLSDGYKDIKGFSLALDGDVIGEATKNEVKDDLDF